ncbi:hypothetical protein FRC12_002536 [Ceratobasidium sp. 428]|nr:hypothetical protein FRC12_002536 [Ceratobasidium sp. 428]
MLEHKACSHPDVYDHYEVSLVRHMRSNEANDGTISETLDYTEFAFTCKTDPARHPVQYRRRSGTRQGTGKLKTSSEACQRRNGLPINCLHNQPAPSPFSYAMHMAIIAMMCAYKYLPYARVLHDLVRHHVQLLHPCTKMPDITTVSRTTQFVYARQTEKVRSYFNDIKTIHFAIDGWTLPTATAYLGLVVHWYHEGQIWRAMLEMIR